MTPGPLRVYRWMMRALPASFVQRFGSDMLGMITGRADELEGRLGGRAVAFWLTEYVDLARTVLREWAKALRTLVIPASGRRGVNGGFFRGGMGEGMGGDLRLAVRSVVRSPGFSAVIVLTLALGMGVNAAIFSIVDNVVLRPLPYEDADALVALRSRDVKSGREANHISYADFLVYRAEAESFAGIEGYTTGSWTLTGPDREPKNFEMATVTQGFFSLLGTEPVLGRTFADEEHLRGEWDVVVLNHEFWKRELGGRSDILGRTIMLESRPRTVIGVMQPGFDYPFLRPMAGWLPMEHQDFQGTDPNLAFTERDWDRLITFGRLNDGVAVESAGAEIEALAAGLAEAYPRSNANLTTRLLPLKSLEVGALRRPLLLVLAAVAAILLIACVNTASLLLARGTSRSGEVAVRTALGASRGRLVRLFLTESLVYAVLGAVVGLVLAEGVLAAVGMMELSAPRLHNVALDGRVMGVTAVVAIATGILFGIAPAFHGSRTDLQSALKDGRRSTGGLGRSRLQKAFVATEMALSTVLVVGAGLLVTSFVNIIGEDPGFDPQNVLSVRISLPAIYMQDEDDMWRGSNEFFLELADDVGRIPGVDAVALSFTNPLEPATAFNTRFEIPGFMELPRAEQPFANLRTVSPGFFDTFRIPLIAGRTFTDRDDKQAPGVAVVNESFARRFFGEEDPIGHKLAGPNFWGTSGYPYPWEIVGVVGDVKSRGLNREPAPAMYFPFMQTPMGNMRVITRSRADVEALAPLIRAAVWEIDDTIPLDELYTMDQFISQSVATPRLAMIAVGSFAALALLLAAIGVYGVLSYTVGRRKAELGIRLVLGADRDRILTLVLRQGMVVAGVGVAIGLAIATATGRVLETFLYEVTATHLPTFLIVTVTLSLVAAVACLVPALRATRIDPAGALRAE